MTVEALIEEYAKIGIDIKKDGQFRPLYDVLEELAQKFNDEEQLDSVISDIYE